jgi:hypothetical protein
MAVTLGSKNVGDIVKLNVTNPTTVATDFIVVHKGKETESEIYNSGFADGVVLLLRAAGDYRAWNSAGYTTYLTPYIKNALEQFYLLTLDPAIQNEIIQVNIPIHSFNTTNIKVSCKIFPLSAIEVGGFGMSTLAYMPQEGVRFDYFLQGDSQPALERRIAFPGGSNSDWWLRTPTTHANEGGAWYCNYAGYPGWDLPSSNKGLRYAIVLPKSILVDDSGNVIAGSAPTAPGTIYIPATVVGATTITISWDAATDADGNLAGYKLEKSTDGGSTWGQIYQGGVTSTADYVAWGTGSVMYRVKAYDTNDLESGYTVSGQVWVLNNSAPGAPGSINVPAEIIGGANLTITWSAASDADGNLAGYTLERSVDSQQSWDVLYQGPNLSYTDFITKGWPVVSYRVSSYDAYSFVSGYAQTAILYVDNNSPPTIASDTSGDIGLKSDGFQWQYIVNDADADAVTVTERISGVGTIRTYTATLGAQQTFDVTGERFMTILNGVHTMEVEATDAGGKTALYQVTFTKGVYSMSITLETPMAADDLITRMVMNITRSIPADAVFQVLATNNANDPSPVWEDVTNAVQANLNHLFTNTTVTNGDAFNFMITVSRGASNIGGYVAAIGGAFE